MTNTTQAKVRMTILWASTPWCNISSVLTRPRIPWTKKSKVNSTSSNSQTPRDWPTTTYLNQSTSTSTRKNTETNSTKFESKVNKNRHFSGLKKLLILRLKTVSYLSSAIKRTFYIWDRFIILITVFSIVFRCRPYIMSRVVNNLGISKWVSRQVLLSVLKKLIAWLSCRITKSSCGDAQTSSSPKTAPSLCIIKTVSCFSKWLIESKFRHSK